MTQDEHDNIDAWAVVWFVSDDARRHGYERYQAYLRRQTKTSKWETN
jgi:hypothetical protein